ncbi:unnamed protein product [Clonostachys solani]|uniref:DUF6546 domain-containing protein n=1 Tax=Clonostachys solani TaxID=160281 RepID=A0A9N9WA29_9HYPO|nr:unnamed protein product [Clonostachys solani]
MSSTTSWASLPAEIREAILSQVGLPILWKRNSDQRPPKVARFASVCRQWQVFFEACTFRRLVLNTGSLRYFNKIIKRDSTRLRYMRNIWLRIRLPEYTCPNCEVPEDKFTQQCNNVVFTDSIQCLLNTLKLWDPDRHGAEGLALMVSASSPSDTTHRFIIGDMRKRYPFHPAEDRDVPPGITDVHRSYHTRSFTFYCHYGDLVSELGGHIKRMQGTPLRFEPLMNETDGANGEYKNLPAVPMIKGLVMRRQNRREIDMRSLSCLLSRSLVSLEWFRLERTVHPDITEQVSFELGFQTHLLPSLPKTLRQFSFVQWKIPPRERRDVLRTVGTIVSPYSLGYLPREMAKLSQRLEQFCPPWQMDTAAFLKSMIELEASPRRVDSSLKRLILRFVPTKSETSRQDFESVVILAAEAALSLPQLEVIELWGTRLDKEKDCDAYIFRYVNRPGGASIVWRSSENITSIQPRIITKWNEVAQKHTHSAVEYSVVPFSETRDEIFNSGGTFIYQHLLLKELAFDRITQIILENEDFYWDWGEASDASLERDPRLQYLADITAEDLAACLEAIDDD